MPGMDNTQNTPQEGTQTAAQTTREGNTGERTFTQEDVNRIVQERLAKERNKGAGNGESDLDKRAAELDKRERRLDAVEQLRKNGLPDYLVDALNIDTEDSFQNSMKAILRMKGEVTEKPPKIIGYGSPIGSVGTGTSGDPIREAFGLK